MHVSSAAATQGLTKDACKAAHLIGVRGQGESALVGNGLGEIPGALVAAVQTELATKPAGGSLAVSFVEYPAVILSDTQYDQSVNIGVNDLTELISQRGKQCPSESIYVVGYGEGAHVVHRYLNSLKNPADTKMLRRATLISNNGHATRTDPARTGNHNVMAWLRNRVEESPIQSLSGVTIKEICSPYDSICSSYFDANESLEMRLKLGSNSWKFRALLAGLAVCGALKDGYLGRGKADCWDGASVGGGGFTPQIKPVDEAGFLASVGLTKEGFAQDMRSNDVENEAKEIARDIDIVFKVRDKSSAATSDRQSTKLSPRVPSGWGASCGVLFFVGARDGSETGATSGGLGLIPKGVVDYIIKEEKRVNVLGGLRYTGFDYSPFASNSSSANLQSALVSETQILEKRIQKRRSKCPNESVYLIGHGTGAQLMYRLMLNPQIAGASWLKGASLFSNPARIGASEGVPSGYPVETALPKVAARKVRQICAVYDAACQVDEQRRGPTQKTVLTWLTLYCDVRFGGYYGEPTSDCLRKNIPELSTVSEVTFFRDLSKNRVADEAKFILRRVLPKA